MNKKIKVFDLIEMFYRKEKMPQRIKVSCYEFEYDEEINAYFNLDKNSINNSLIQDWLNNASKLNNEVEILEDNTEEIKDKVIDMMANELRDTCHFEYMSRKEVKEYFYNKIEIPEEN